MHKIMDDFEFKGRKVLVRCDFNVPVDDDGNVLDDWKIRKTLPTIKHLLDKGAKQIVLMSHLGRPKGEIVESLKMNKVADKLVEILGQQVLKLNDCIDESAPEDERIVLLENLRFHKAEKENNEHFAKALSEYGEIFVNDAFGTSHRPHASVAGVPKFLPSCAGKLLEYEIKHLKSILHPERPAAALFGFAKVGGKLDLMKNMLERLDFAIFGGAVVFTFLKSKGFEVGKSRVDEDHVQSSKYLLVDYEDKIVLPTDFVVAKEKDESAEAKTCGIADFPFDRMGLDIGPESIDYFKKKLSEAKTVIWNGPMGVFEIEKFAKGTREIAEWLAESGKTVVICGGDTAEAIRKWGLEDKMTHVSTGGGASIEYLEGKELPGITALEENALRF